MSLNTLEAMKPKFSNLQFYMHDIVGGPNATAMRVAPSQPLNFSGTNLIASMFGSIYVIDDPLTATPDPKSKLLGRAQGIYAMSSLGDEFSLLMTLTYSFIRGPYKLNQRCWKEYGDEERPRNADRWRHRRFSTRSRVLFGTYQLDLGTWRRRPVQCNGVALLSDVLVHGAAYGQML